MEDEKLEAVQIGELENEYARGRGMVTLVVIFLAPIFAWAFHLNLNYFLTRIICDTGLIIIPVLITLALLAASLWAAWVGWRSYNKMGAVWPSGSGGVIFRSRFLAISAVINGIWFALMIIAQGIPVVMLDPCL
jgi:hypothetical protein